MNSNSNPDIILIGAGIMSATLGTMLNQLMPGATIEIYERLDQIAQESSDAWNNAGTGHSAFCELNYTPEKADGSIDTTKAVKICASFEESKQFWAYLVEKALIQPPSSFIHSIPHMSFVWGEKNVTYLRKRYEALTRCFLFEGMLFSTSPEQIAQWAPLIMEGRNPEEPGLRLDEGTRAALAFTKLAQSGNTLGLLSRHEGRLRRTIERASLRLEEMKKCKNEPDSPPQAA